jgi:diguanylate cyclase (GGDEF)-like protein/PAS domain S-box-containing protein
VTSDVAAHDDSGHPLDRTATARLAAALYALCGLVIVAVSPWLPARSHAGLAAVGVCAMVAAGVIALLPWHRWPRLASLWIALLALVLIAAHNIFTGIDGFRYTVLFTVLAAWIGLGHRRGTTLAMSPLIAVAYVVPLLERHAAHGAPLISLVYGVPLSVLIGESIGWVTTRLARTQDALSQSDAAWQAVFDESPMPMWVYDRSSLRFLAVNDAAVRHYGWSRDEFLSMTSAQIRPAEAQEALLADLERPVTQFDGGALRLHCTKDGSILQVEVYSRLVPAWGADARLVVALDVTDRRRAATELARRSVRDELTGLPNRALLVDRLVQAIGRSGTAVSVLLMDLDRFRRLNELIGSAAADDVVRAAGQRIRAVVGRESTVGRWGGDSFLVIVESADRAAMNQLAQAITAAFGPAFEAADRTVELSASIGGAVGRLGSDSGSLLADAENALALAKAAGRGQFAFLDDHARYRAATRRTVEQELTEAIRDGQLHLVYQPQVSLADERLVAVEALVRWTHPVRGAIPPAEFIPIAEESGVIGELGDWVLDEACRQAAIWGHQGSGPARISVNVSAMQVADRALPALVLDRLRAHGLAPDRLRLELTEHALAAPSAGQVLDQLSEAGIGLSLDDFGTGYSSLAYLRRFPIDEIKVDRSFVAGMTTNDRDRAIVNNIVRLGTEMHLTTVAEGIETPVQAAHLSKLGCTLGQGYYWSRPFRAENLERWLRTRPSPGVRPALHVVRPQVAGA